MKFKLRPSTERELDIIEGLRANIGILYISGSLMLKSWMWFI